MSGRITKFGLSLVVTAIAALALSASASACSCAGLPGTEIFRQSDGAIVGKLLRVEPVGDGFNADYVYRVVDGLKKRNRFEAGQIRRVRSATESAACGIEQPIGTVTGLYLSRLRDGRLTSNLCSITSPARIRRTAKNVAAENGGKRLTSAAAGGCAAASA
jgi:hypothetical protein